MIRIEIRDSRGALLVSEPTMTAVIAQLVNLVEHKSGVIAAYAMAIDKIQALPPDTSATAPEHVIGFRAGWHAFRLDVKNLINVESERTEG